MAFTCDVIQGLTLEKAVLDLRTDLFVHGQLYTALSRVRFAETFERYLQEKKRKTQQQPECTDISYYNSR